MNRFGVTSVQSDDLEATALEELDEAVALLRAQGRMTLRLFEEVQAPTMAALQAFLQRGRRSGAGDAWYKIGNVKLLLDGSLGAGTAWMREGYARGGRGICVYGDRELQALVRLANGAGMQIAFHAIGDAAASQAVAAVELAQRQGRRDLRHRLVHAQFLDDELIARLRFSGMGADIQPAFTATELEGRPGGAFGRQPAHGLSLAGSAARGRSPGRRIGQPGWRAVRRCGGCTAP